MESIGERVKRMRGERGITQLQIKELTGISSGNMSDIERGKSLPSASAVMELSRIFDCSTDEILFGSSRKSDISDVISETEEELLKNFRELDQDSQEEIMDIIFMKLRRIKRAAKDMARSSNSNSTNTSDKLA